MINHQSPHVLQLRTRLTRSTLIIPLIWIHIIVFEFLIQDPPSIKKADINDPISKVQDAWLEIRALRGIGRRLGGVVVHPQDGTDAQIESSEQELILTLGHQILPVFSFRIANG